ncbi:hypothetical protein ACP70R_037613 [Stipagrostis hirtigluma subsp. patula]
MLRLKPTRIELHDSDRDELQDRRRAAAAAAAAGAATPSTASSSPFTPSPNSANTLLQLLHPPAPPSKPSRIAPMETEMEVEIKLRVHDDDASPPSSRPAAVQRNLFVDATAAGAISRRASWPGSFLPVFLAHPW